MASSTDLQKSSQYVDPDTGFLMMPGTRRPDGTWRKPRRIREGYVPQDEVPLYESKGKQWAKSKEDGAVTGGIFHMKIDTFDSRSLQPAYHIPGLSPDTPPVGASSSDAKGKNAKKKKKGGGGGGSNHVNNAVMSNHVDVVVSSSDDRGNGEIMDPAKKLRNLRKKLRDIESLEKKLESGEIKTPEPDQLEKVARRKQVEEEIEVLEKQLGS